MVGKRVPTNSRIWEWRCHGHLLRVTIYSIYDVSASIQMSTIKNDTQHTKPSHTPNGGKHPINRYYDWLLSCFLIKWKCLLLCAHKTNLFSSMITMVFITESIRMSFACFPRIHTLQNIQCEHLKCAGLCGNTNSSNVSKRINLAICSSKWIIYANPHQVHMLILFR